MNSLFLIFYRFDVCVFYPITNKNGAIEKNGGSTISIIDFVLQSLTVRLQRKLVDYLSDLSICHESIPSCIWNKSNRNTVDVTNAKKKGGFQWQFLWSQYAFFAHVNFLKLWRNWLGGRGGDDTLLVRKRSQHCIIGDDNVILHSEMLWCWGIPPVWQFCHCGAEESTGADPQGETVIVPMVCFISKPLCVACTVVLLMFDCSFTLMFPDNLHFAVL